MKGEKGVRDSELKTEGKRKSSLSTPEKKDLTHYFVLHEQCPANWSTAAQDMVIVAGLMSVRVTVDIKE